LLVDVNTAALRTAVQLQLYRHQQTGPQLHFIVRISTAAARSAS
jgi:hypothetical protein